jgi:prepilin-type N-terminal cleavage/methylation domain-containing protein
MNHRRLRAFTLIEILAAVSVLAIIMIMAAQLLNISSSTWKRGSARTDNFTQARATLGLIERDIQSMVLRRDLGAFVDASGNPACAFYTRFPAPDGTRKLSLVQYKFNYVPPGQPELLRFDSPFNYSNTDPNQPALTLSTTDKLPDLDSATNPNIVSQNISEGIIAFQIQFLDGNGDLQDRFSFDFDNTTVSGNTQAAVISIALLDRDAALLAQKLNQLPPLIQSLAGALESPQQSYAQLWNKKISTTGFGTSLAIPVRNGLHIYEKRINIPITTVK